MTVTGEILSNMASWIDLRRGRGKKKTTVEGIILYIPNAANEIVLLLLLLPSVLFMCLASGPRMHRI